MSAKGNNLLELDDDFVHLQVIAGLLVHRCDHARTLSTQHILHLHGLHDRQLLARLDLLSHSHTAGDEGARHGAQQVLRVVLHHRGEHVAVQRVLLRSAHNHLLLAAEVAQSVTLGSVAQGLDHHRGLSLLAGAGISSVEHTIGQGLANVPVEVAEHELHGLGGISNALGVHRGDASLALAVDVDLHVVSLALGSAQHHHVLLLVALFVLLVIIISGKSLLVEVVLLLLGQGLGGNRGSGGGQKVRALAVLAAVAQQSLLLNLSCLGGTKPSELLVTGAVEGGGQGQELEGLVLLQLHAVETVGILVADELGRVVTGAEGGVSVDISEEGDVVAEALHHVLVEGAFHEAHRLLSSRGVCAQLADHRIVVHGDGGSFEHTSVDADSAGGQFLGLRSELQRLTVSDEGADGRQEASQRILGIDTTLDGTAVGIQMGVLGETVRDLLAGGNVQHVLHQVLTGDQLGDGVLHLQSGVHLQEVKVLLGVGKHLHGTGGAVVGGLAQQDGLLLHQTAGGRGQQAGRRLLHHLLVAALHRALSLGKSHDIAEGIGDDLDLDVVGVLDESLDQHAVIAEGALGLGLTQSKALSGLLVVVRHTHALASTASRSLQHHRVAHLVGKGDRMVLVSDLALVAGDDEASGVLGDLLGRQLVTHSMHGATGGTDEGQTSRFNHVHELGILGQEAISRVNCLSATLLGHVENAVHAQIRIIRLSGSNSVGLVGHLHMHTRSISIRVNSHSLDTKLLGGTNNTASNLSSVGNQNLIEGLALVATLAKLPNSVQQRIRSRKNVFQHFMIYSKYS
mmetsp:Transcript_41879/g.72734  ORF Transcript_41879/g.72734 Transcript_41879/m.72734 type:complete len:797 (+) Transcript_41879:128-2518(+)